MTPATPAVRVVWVDAFSEQPCGGNPAAVCLLAGPAPAAGMQALAAELGLSETAFVWPEGDGFALRWFTPVTEVERCGHATVAAAHALAGAGLVEGGSTVTFSTARGLLSAALAGGRVEIDLPSDAPTPVTVPEPLARRWSVVGAARGTDDLVVELASADDVRSADGAFDEIARLPFRGVAVTAAGDGAASARCDYVLRFFAPAVGVPEDPVTGSVQCVLGPYWAARTGRARLEALQLSARGGRLGVEVRGERVRVAGGAVTVLEGVLAPATASLVTPSPAGHP